MPAKQTAAQSWKYIPGDYNGDGKTDIVTASPDGFGGFWHLFVFNGSNFDKTTQGALPSYPNINTLGDITK